MKAFFWEGGGGINARRHVRKKILFGRLCACDVQTLLFAAAVKTQQLQRRKVFFVVDATRLCLGLVSIF